MLEDRHRPQTTSLEATMTTTDPERDNLLGTLADRRAFLRGSAEGLTDDQARATPTISALSIGGLVKHVTATERQWMDFIREGATDTDVDYDIDWSAIDWSDPASVPEWVLRRQDEFLLREDQTLAELLDDYAACARETEELVAGLADLGIAHELAPAPWNEPGASMSARQVLAHLIGETAQHAGHADIVRETIDGRKAMG
jgi:uncharacterized damage-inducible protein DinB